MWDGALSPRLSKAADTCRHGGTFVEVGEPEFGAVEIRVEFNHTCSGRPAPSNNTVYTFEVELDSFTDAQYDEAADLQAELDQMSSSEKTKWVSDNLVWEKS